MTSYFPLPVTLEEITAEWLTAAIRQRAPGATVLGFEAVDYIRTTATKVRLRLKLDEAAKRAGVPELVILKGGFEAHSQKVGIPEMHLKEVQAYRDVFPALKLPAPACYFADYDHDRKQGIVIMEDLVARGVTFCHALRPQTFEEASRRLRALASFHAKTWDNPDLQPGGQFGNLHEFLGNLMGFVNYHLEPETWERFNGSAQRACVSQTLLSREWMADAFPRMVTFARTLPQCVIHGDMHLNNLYIDTDGTPGFYDSLATTGPGMLEVAYHISAGVDLANRARWEAALVNTYLDELVRNGVAPIPFDEAMRQYKILLLYGHFVWITNESHYQSDAINTANAARAGQAMLDHDVMALIAQLPG
jgi:aminoglycoside/choline kinase family phosphotransferase